MRKLVLVCCLSAFALSGVAQIGQNEGREIFFSKTACLRNASLIDTSSSVQIGNDALLGAFNTIRKFYAIGNIALNRDKRMNFGLRYSSDQEGDLIALNRFGLHYALRLDITPSMQLAMGAEAGLVNFNLEGTINTNGGSDFSGDYALSLALFKENMSFGAAIKPVNNPELQPIAEKIVIDNQWFLYGSRLWSIGLVHKIEWSAEVIAMTNYFKARTRIGYVFNDLFEAGVVMSNESFAYDFGIKYRAKGGPLIFASFGHQIPISDRFNSTFSPVGVMVGVGF